MLPDGLVTVEAGMSGLTTQKTWRFCSFAACKRASSLGRTHRAKNSDGWQIVRNTKLCCSQVVIRACDVAPSLKQSFQKHGLTGAVCLAATYSL